MKGLELSRQYFNEKALPRLKTDFPEIFPRLAAGLVGNGSECFGYDDEASRDHDWGADFFIWVTESDRPSILRLSQWKRELMEHDDPPEFSRLQSMHGAQIGVMTCGDFYKSLIGTAERPVELIKWLRIPEENLAMAVNGDVFIDNAGEFTAVRESLLRHYPEDVRLKKIAAKCMAIAQTGQYNHMRMAARGEFVVVHTVISKFIEQVTGLVFLLNRVYKPYYKWSHRMLLTLPLLGADIGSLIEELVMTTGYDEKALDQQQSIIRKICLMLTDELRKQRLSSAVDWFLARHGESVQSKISDPFLRSLPAQFE